MDGSYFLSFLLTNSFFNKKLFLEEKNRTNYFNTSSISNKIFSFWSHPVQSRLFKSKNPLQENQTTLIFTQQCFFFSVKLVFDFSWLFPKTNDMKLLVLTEPIRIHNFEAETW